MLNLHEEIILPVKDFENLYLISNQGYISNGRKKLKPFINNNGYYCLKLVKNGERTNILLHRIVAQHFIQNPENKPEVNHEDGDKSNCAAYNLSWMTSSENKIHAKNTGLKEYNNPSKGIKLGKSSRFHNVLWDKSRSKWVGVVRHQNKNYFAKRFEKEEDAAKHVNCILDQLNLTDRPKNIV